MAIFKCAALRNQPSSCSRSPDQRFDADPDIAGIGVIVGFLTTSGLAFLVAFAVLFLDRFDKIITFFRKNLTKNQDSYQHPAPTTSSRSPTFWSFVLAKNLLSLADTQILTGLAIQFTALLRHCQLTFYHWGIVTDLALLTTVTHLLTVVALRDYFVKNKWINLPRILSMLGNLGFLGYTQYTYYSSEVGGLAYSNMLACYFRQPDRPGLRNIGGGRVTLLASAILSHVAVIFAMYIENTKQPSTGEHEVQNRRIWSRILQVGAIFRTWIIAPAYSIYGIYTAASGLKITQAMGNNSIAARMDGSESKWGFGQYLPVLLVALPIFAGWESYWEEKDPDRENRFRSSVHNSRSGSQAVLDRHSGQPVSKPQQRSRDPSVEEKRVESSWRHRSASRSSIDPRGNVRRRPESQISISPLPTPAIPSPLRTPPLPTPSPHLSVPSSTSPQTSSVGRSSPTLAGGNSSSRFGGR